MAIKRKLKMRYEGVLICFFPLFFFGLEKRVCKSFRFIFFIFFIFIFNLIFNL